MTASITLTQTAIFTALVTVLGAFGLVTNAGAAVPIVRGQVNRVPEPNGQDFIVKWPIARDRIAMNIDTALDVECVGSITANVLTATSIVTGPLEPGQTIYTIASGAVARIVAQLTGSPGGTGTYSTTTTANVTSQHLYCGTISALQETEITIQADVHGPASADNAQRLSTLFRDQFAVDQFAAVGLPITPLYTTEPKQIPFDNGEQQVEERWVVDLCMQADIAIVTTMQFAERLDVTTTPVEAIEVP